MFNRAHIFEQFLHGISSCVSVSERIDISCVFSAYQRALIDFQSGHNAMGQLALKRAVKLKDVLQPTTCRAIEAISEHPVSAYRYYVLGMYDEADAEIRRSLEKLADVTTSDPVGSSLAQLEQELNIVRVSFRRGAISKARAHLIHLLAALQNPMICQPTLLGEYRPLANLDIVEQAELRDYLIAAAPTHLRANLVRKFNQSSLFETESA